MPLNVPFPSGGLPSQRVGPSGGSAVASGLAEALRMFLQLRQQGVQNQHLQAQDDLDRQRLTQSGEYQQLLAKNAADRQTELALQGDEKGAQWLAGNYGGKKFDPTVPEEKATIDMFGRAKMQGALQPERIPLQTNLGVDATRLGEAMPPAYFEPTATGRMEIAPTDSEKLRVAVTNAQGANARAGANILSRESIAADRNKTANRAIDIRDALGEARNAIARSGLDLRKYGIDQNNQVQWAALESLAQARFAGLDETQYRDQMRALASPLGLIQFMQQGGLNGNAGAGMPKAPTLPQYATPRPPGGFQLLPKD